MNPIRSSILFLFMILPALQAAGQKEGVYTLHLKDKKGTLYNLDHPEEFLSAGALARREREQIPVTYEDLPVSQAYLDTLQSLGMKIYCRSRWFNTVTGYLKDSVLYDTVSKQAFVDSIRLVKPVTKGKSVSNKWETAAPSEITQDYLFQLSLLNGVTVHERGYRGKGVVVAVLDAGFYRADVLPAFDSLRDAGRILGTRDMVARNTTVWDDHSHGMYVLSILAGNLPGELMGAAPDASYWLIRTEDVYSEYPVEEEYWLAGAELADSVGADIISSSLGYYTFDDSSFDHTYDDMNGRTTVAARAAVMAARRGIIVVNSAGNERNKTWYYIITPADADSILAVGAVDTLGNPSAFTSSGPSADGRVKPDVAALGVGVFVQLPDSSVRQGNGTSFSAPLIAGMTACLRQAFPDTPSQKIIQAIREAANHFNDPDVLTGYGIPDMTKPFETLRVAEKMHQGDNTVVYPNPFSDQMTVAVTSRTGGTATLTIYNMTGSIILKKETQLTTGLNLLHNDLSQLSAGMYLLKIDHNGAISTLHVIKIR
jgi:hypothetical protein